MPHVLPTKLATHMINTKKKADTTPTTDTHTAKLEMSCDISCNKYCLMYDKYHITCTKYHVTRDKFM